MSFTKKEKSIFKTAIVLGLLTFVSNVSTSCNKPVIVDKMLYGNVVTLDQNNNRVEAIGIKNDKIVYLGKKNNAQNHINESTEIIDYQNNYIYPGFVDAHSHPALFGAAIAGGCLVTPDMNAQETLAFFKSYIDEHPGQTAYKCYGSYAALKSGNADMHYTYKLLDECLGENAKNAIVAVLDYGGHSACLNSFGINKLTAQFNLDVEKIKQQKLTDVFELEDVDNDGQLEINGNISETPMMAFSNSIPISIQDLKKGILTMQDNVLAPMGYTTVTDCAVRYNDIPTIVALSELADEGKLKFKIRAYYLVTENEELTAQEQIDLALTLAVGYNTEYFKIVGIKLILDGVTEKESCYTIDPYSINPYPEEYPENDYRGIFRWGDAWRPKESPASIKDIIIKANQSNLSVTAHAYGDAAVRYILDQYEEARKVVKYERNSISHCAYVDDADLPRFKDLNISPIVAPHWSCREADSDKHEEGIFGVYDPSKPNARSLQKMHKIKSYLNLDSNSHISFHTDGMCADGVPYMLYSAVNRVDPNNADPNAPGYIGPRDANEDVTISEALRCMTANPAYLLGEENNIGSIELNKSADFSIYPADFTDPNNFKQENHQIAFTKAIATYVNGKIAYSNE